MKRLLILLITFCVSILYAEEGNKIDSKVISATVFKNRALVTREGEIDLSKGKHKLIFSNLPVDLLDESVRVSAGESGNVKILDVRVEQRFTTETQQKSVKDLEGQIDSINQLILICMDKIAVFNSKREFVESLKAQSSKYINEKMLLSISNTKEWGEMLSYVDNNLSEIYKGIREQTRKKTLLEQKVNALKAEISQSQGKKSKNFKEVIVNVDVASRSSVKLYPSYLVQNASWYPVYDARVLSQSKGMELYYFGMLQQSTGEDWNDIRVTLSTAEPLSMKSLPRLERWFVDARPLPARNNYESYSQTSNSEVGLTYERNWGLPSGKGAVSGYVIDGQTGEPLIGVNVVLEGTRFGSATDANGRFFISDIPKSQYGLAVNYIGYQQKRVILNINEKNTANLTVPIAPSSIETNAVTVVATKPEVLKDAADAISIRGGRANEIGYYAEGVNIQSEQFTNVFARELSTTFEIPSKNSIPSDNTYHKVTIAIERSLVDFSYTSIPKINPSVYLKGKMVNKEQYPFLEGEINVFVDNDFINRTYINTIVPTDTLELALGIDERIQVKKVLVNKFQESKGLLGGKKQITYEYEIQIHNNRQTEETILVLDQAPIAMNENINVELLEPKKDIKELGNEKKLEWKIKLKPGEKKVIPVKYQVSHPNDLTVYGLD